MILFTKVDLPYGWLSNMSPHPVTLVNLGLGVEFRTAEHLFQAFRFDDRAIVDLIRDAKSPMAAKMIAKKHAAKMVVRPRSLPDVKNMLVAIALKLVRHPDLKDQLLATGDQEIIEDCTRRQNESGLFWGAARTADGWIGKNVLGRLWGKVRDIYQAKVD